MSCHFAKLPRALTKDSRWSRGFPPSQTIGGGQKARPSEGISQNHPLSASQESWRRGSNFPRDLQIFPPSVHHLAEGVKSPRKMQVSWAVSPIIRRGASRYLATCS